MFSETVPVGVPPDVHPVSTPAFAVMRTFKQSINDTVPRSRTIVSQERSQFILRWRKADQVKINPPQQQRLLHSSDRLQPKFAMLRRDERVNRILRRNPLARRQVCLHGPLKRPVFTRVRVGFFVLGSRSTVRDPLSDGINLSRFERFTFWRHSEVVIVRHHPHQQLAEFNLLHINDRTVGSASNRRCRIEPQIRLLFQRAVTRVTPSLQNGLHVFEVVIGDGLPMRNHDSDYR